MKACVLLCCTSAIFVSLAGSAHAQSKSKGPVSKLFVAEATGESQIQSGDKVFTARQATAFEAPGTIIETKENSHNAFVYSNGTGLYVDENSRVEIDRFVQEPFNPDRNSTEVEPSISQSEVFLTRGSVGICTSQLVSGSAMTYSTPHASINIRGRKLAVEVSAQETTVYLLEGDLTVRSSNPSDGGGMVLRAGEQAAIRSRSAGMAPTITVGTISGSKAQALDGMVTVACNAKKTVSFEMIERKAEQGVDNPAGDDPSGSSSLAGTAGSSGDTSGTQEVVARPTTPIQLPTTIVVSPSSLTP